MLRLGAGAHHTIDGGPQPSVFFTLEGSFHLGAGETYRQYTALLVEADDRVSVATQDGATLLELHLPLK